MTNKYKNLEKSKKCFSKEAFKIICKEIIVWDNQLIKKLNNNGRFSQIDVDYLISLIEDDIEFMVKYYNKNV